MTKAHRTTGPPRSFLLLKSGALLSLGFLNACQIVCDDDRASECREEFIVEFDDELADGSYVFEVTTDEADVSCTLELPKGTTACTGDTGKGGLNPEIDAVSLVVPGTPTNIMVRITGESSGQSSDKNFSPEYEGQYPNGTECPPACLKAIDTLDAVAP